jgi:hypothetical protein
LTSLCPSPVKRCVGSKRPGAWCPGAFPTAIRVATYTDRDTALLNTLFLAKMTSMSMSNSMPGPACPEIEASELKAVRDFLTSFRDDQPRPRPFARQGERKAPAVSNGIARARFRSASRAAD